MDDGDLVGLPFQSRTGFPGLLAPRIPSPSPYHLLVSIPGGLPGPVSLAEGQIGMRSWLGFNPARASQAGSPGRFQAIAGGIFWFQSRSGFPGWFADIGPVHIHPNIPFQSRTGLPGLLTTKILSKAGSILHSFNPARASRAF